MSDVWITAAEAYERVARTNHFGAAQAICARANDGILVAKADTLIVDDVRQPDAEIPARFWWARGNGATIAQNWQSGDFSTWIDHRSHWRAYGVKFREVDIADMVPPSLGGPKVAPAIWANYESSLRCVQDLEKQLDCTREAAGAHIVRFCRAGMIDSRCAEIRWEFQDLTGKREEVAQKVAIPDWFWENCTTGPDSILDWKSGRLAGRGLVDGKMHKVKIKGAEFDVSGIVDLEAMLAEQNSTQRPAIGAASPNAPREKAGGRPKSEKWANWIAALVHHVHHEGIPDGEGVEGQDAMIAAIESQFANPDSETLRRSTVQPVVRAVLQKLRSAEN